MSYVPLGSRTAAGALDSTGLDPGSYSNFFGPAQLGVNQDYFEVYSMSVTGLTTLATVTVYVNGQVRSTALLFGNSEWDPNQPILLIPGDQLTLAWDFGTGAAPTATVWLRYDPAIQVGST